MRQQLRLRVLVPVAVLGLLGAGFGAFAMGGPATPESIPVRATSSGAVDTGATDTGAVDTTPTTTAPAPPPPPTAGEVDPAAWAEQANALCAQLNEQLGALGEFESPKEAQEWFAQALELMHAFEDDFVALGWPTGQQAAVLELQAGNARAVDFTERFLAAIKAGDGNQLVELAEDQPGDKASERESKATLRELGATECAKDSAEDWDVQARASALLQWQLLKYRAVIVVFYSPESDLDGAAVFEARAAALETNAGFLPVDVTKEKQVAAIAVGYEVLGSPTVLVVSRGPRLRAEFRGFVDRETVAQAVTNAVR
jgi:hypothetical protein